MKSCDPSTASAVALGFLIYAVMMTASMLSFYGWRRLRVPWRTICFVIFALCALCIVDACAIAFTLPTPPASASPPCT